MRTAIRNIVAHTYKPLLEKYLSKTRSYRYGNIRLDVPPEVFHPGFFFSTKLLLNYTKQFQLAGKTVLELGCGSGLISFYASRQGATVTASDINPVAIEYLERNCQRNGVKINIVESNLFEKIPQQEFDFILINPPYYRKTPVTAKDYAWYCGENGEYFVALFKEISSFIHAKSEVIMIAFENIDQQFLNTLARRNGLKVTCMKEYRNVLERNYILKIENLQ